MESLCFPSELPALRHHLAEVGALQQFHRLVEHAIGLAGFEDADQIGMVETRGRSRLRA